MTETKTQDSPAHHSKIYFEAGANDGKFQSRTLKYHNNPEWFGILVEPDPRCYDGLLRNRNSDNVSILPYALVSSIDTKSINLYQHHASAMNMVEGSDKLNIDGKGLKALKVQSRTIQSICDQIGIDTIDEFYLDIEGYEVEALKGIKDLNIKFAEIENHGKTPEAFEKYKREIVDEMFRLGLVLSNINKTDGNPKLEFHPGAK